MPWKPAPRWDEYSGRYRVRLKGRTFVLGTEYATAYARFRDIHIKVMGVPPDEDPPPRFMSDLIARWRRKHTSKWAATLLESFAQFCGAHPLPLPKNSLIDYDAELVQSKNSVQTRRHKVTVAMRVLKWSMDEGLIKSVPKMPKLPKIPKRPKDVPLSKLIEIEEGLKSNPRALAIFRFILATGCRPSEACLLRWRDVNIPEFRVEVVNKTRWSTGHPTRTVFINPAAIEALEDARRIGPATTNGFVFLTRYHKPYTTSGLRTVLRKYGITPYQLRHSFAQNLLEQETHIEVLGKVLGHCADSRMTSVYAQVRDRQARASVCSSDDALTRARRLQDSQVKDHNDDA